MKGPKSGSKIFLIYIMGKIDDQSGYNSISTSKGHWIVEDNTVKSRLKRH